MNNPDSTLPQEYVKALEDLSLKPAWLGIRSLTPHGKPIRNIRLNHWAYDKVRPLLMQAGKLAPIELAERRVLALQNPGVAPPRLATTPTMFLGLQLIKPGEHAEAHRHTPAAARLVVEGAGAVTIVNGERLPMEAGDLLLTPPHFWHEHVHEGPDPMVWMDILDHPISIPMEVSYLVEKGDPDSGYVAPSNMPDSTETTYLTPGLIPFRSPAVPPQRYAMMRFPWRRARTALEKICRYTAKSDPIHMMYVNPESGASLLETMCFSVRMLRPSEAVSVPRRSASAIFFALEGAGETVIDGEEVAWKKFDTIACPSFATIQHRNASNFEPAFLLQVDDGPAQFKLGYYEDEHLRLQGITK